MKGIHTQFENNEQFCCRPIDALARKQQEGVPDRFRVAPIDAPKFSLRKPLRLGFVPLCDCAPIVMAHELGFFKKYDLRVRLNREVGWATIRDKIAYGELDAAHALAPMVFAASLGLEGTVVDCVTSLVLNLHGNAITLSQPVAKAVGDPESLRAFLAGHRERLVLGIPFLYSAHYFLLLAWLNSLGISAENSAQFVVVPPPQMPLNLKAGHLDGYCVGEPWNSIAVLANFGVIAATSAEIAPMHPEKVLMVPREFAETRAEEHKRLIAALLEACRYCDKAENRGHVIETLSRKQYLNAPVEALRLSLAGETYSGGGQEEKPVAARPVLPGAGLPGRGDFTIFARNNANEPSDDKAAWILDGLRDSGLCKQPELLNRASELQVFSSEPFHEALRACNPNQLENEDKNESEAEPALQ
jgi:ABC-type nitrate/sulfonate/bicarbonate transport system substrate-binding protein